MMDHRAFKTEINEQFARIAKAIANPHRLELVDLLAQGERSVEELANEAALSIANASQHLQALREAHLIIARKQGLRVYYRLADATIYQLVQLIRQIAEHQLAEVERIVDTYLTERKVLEPVTLNELMSRLREPGLIVLDVRPALEYTQGHIAGARSIPIDELQQRLNELPPDQEIVAYCRGTYCIFADEAVELLLSHGYQARRMQQGYPDWKLAELPTEID
ncbi:MAG TPA: metalloregulator ArsR/SmtB family transcription factor [Aggregatilineales bacterium]|nr:metalloregulator ArsR/SmtB family transcription factor [Aggregatilineales bacterium]